MKGVNKEDPIMKEFVDNLENINALAEKSDGFIWRPKEESNDATSFNPYHDEQVIINMSVWKDVDSLKKFTYETYHSEFIKRRKEWFTKYGQAHHAMWWIKEGAFPAAEKAMARLKFLQKKGPSNKAFDFKSVFPCPQ